MAPESSASRSASISTSPPRPTLTRTAVSFMAASAARSIMPAVSSEIGSASTTKSASGRNAARSAIVPSRSTPGTGSADRLIPWTVMPNAPAYCATRLPMAPSPTMSTVVALRPGSMSLPHLRAFCCSRSSRRRLAPHMRPAKASSATSGALAPGLCVTGTPLARMPS